MNEHGIKRVRPVTRPRPWSGWGSTLAALAGAAILAPATLGQVQIDSVVKVGPTRPGDLDFGFDVARDADLLVVGAPGGDTGEVRVYRQQGAAWVLEQILTPSAGTAKDFGWSVDVSGDRILVGSPEDQGTIFFFAWNGSQWNQQQMFTSPSGGDDKFGRCVAIDGTLAIAGAPDDNHGSAAIYMLGAGGWALETQVYPSDDNDSKFGTSVGLSGSRAVVGSPSGVGAAYIFAEDGPDWMQQQRLTTPSMDDAKFGTAVAIDNSQLIVGAPTGAADGYASVYTLAGNSWSLETMLFPFGPDDEKEFGSSVDILANLALVGAPQNVNGTAFLFSRSAGTWQDEIRLRDFGNSNDDKVGTSVALTPDSAAVGAPEDDDLADSPGSTLLFDLSTAPPKGTPCPGDFDDDGDVDGADFGALLSEWGDDDDDEGDEFEDDLDDDGIIGGGDLGILLASWGICDDD